jgi:Na+-driven multidrug efflux pump
MHKPTLSLFQQVFFTVVAFTLLSGGGAITLASQANLTPEQTRILETLDTTWKIGIGTIFGLLGSKTPDLLQPQIRTDSDEDEEMDD